MKKAILFCNLPYAFAILKPLSDELQRRGVEILWYLSPKLEKHFPYQLPYTTQIADLKHFESDAIFVPGNDVPWYLRGVKVEIFHGMAGEKKGHFRIRGYFDLYLTQGPYFTERFKTLQEKYQNFEVKETGWSKLDPLFSPPTDLLQTKTAILAKSGAKKLLLYAPTFSPSLTSAPALLEQFEKLKDNPHFYTIVKFHDKIDPSILKSYEALQSDRLIIDKRDDITPLLQMCDLMISDTSSVVYEFLLLDKPVITLNSRSEHIRWRNITHPDQLCKELDSFLEGSDPMREKRREIIDLYHPYQDAQSSKRMIEATQSYINNFGIPKRRKLSLLRKYKIWKKYGC